jgi:integrase
MRDVHQMSTNISAKRFTAAHLNALKPAATRRDISDPAVAGLVLRVLTTGTKSWLFRFNWNGKATRISLGTFPTLGLAEARELALKNREWLNKGIDPRRAVDRNARLSVRASTSRPAPACSGVEPPDPKPFLDRLAATPKNSIPTPDPGDKSSVLFIAYEYVEKWFKNGKKPRNPTETCRMLRKDVLPKWHWRDARTITAREIIECLDAIVARGAPVAANRTATMLSHMFRFAIHRSTLENSPVQLLYKPGGKEQRRKRVLSEGELRSFVRNIRTICRTERRARVLMVLLLTMQRRSELALAEWCEFDFENKRWQIPATRTKNRREHVVPLTDWAIAELKALREMAKGSRFVIPGKGENRAANPKLITRGVKRLLPRFLTFKIEAFTPHDLRRTGRTSLGRLGVTPFIAERVINHSKDALQETYDLWEYFDEKRAALERWEEYLLGLMAEPRTRPRPGRISRRRVRRDQTALLQNSGAVKGNRDAAPMALRGCDFVHDGMRSLSERAPVCPARWDGGP